MKPRQLLQKLTGKGKQVPQPPTPCASDCEYNLCFLHPAYSKKPGVAEYRYYVSGKCPEL